MAGRTQGADKSNCPACGLPVVTQWVGRTAALKVTADTEPIPHAEAVLLSEPNRLAWCLVQLHGGGVELRWKCRTKCSHSTVIEHRCPPDAREYGRKPEGAMW